MKLHIFLIIFLSLFQSIYANEIRKDEVKPNLYSIKLGVFKEKESIDKIKKTFSSYDIAVIPYKNRKHVYLTNLNTKDDAKNLLQTKVKKLFKDAYILKNHFSSKKYKTVPSTKKIATKIKIQTKLKPEHEKNNSTKQQTISAKSSNKKIKKLVSTPVRINKTIKDQKGISLHKALLIALNRSKKILSLREKVIQQKRKVDEKRGAFMPNVTLYSNAGYNYVHTRSDKKTEDKYPTADAQLSITENIYAGGKHSASLKKEKAKLKSESASFREKVEDETLKIIEAYLNLYYQKKAIDIENKNMQNLQKILKIVQIKEKNGATSKGDLNNIKSKVENASSALVKASSKYQNTLAFYEYFLGKDNAKYKPSQGEFHFSVYSKKQLFKNFEKYNAKLQINRYKLLAQKYDYQAKKAPFRPNVDLIVTGKEKFSKANVDPYRDEKASAVLSLNYNLYKGGQDKAKLLASKSKIAQLQYQYTDMLESTKYNLKQLFENISSLDDSLIHTKKEVDANKKALQSYWDSFKYGNQDIQTLLLAQRALNRSQQDLLKEKENYILGHFKLLKQTGEILQFLHIEDFVNPKKIIQRY